MERSVNYGKQPRQPRPESKVVNDVARQADSPIQLVVHTDNPVRDGMEPIIARYRDLDMCRFFRGDAAFARPELYEYLESERYLYAIRLPANEVLHRQIEPLLTRPVGRPPNKPVVWYHDFLYQAGSWDRPRRVVAKIEHHKGPDIRRDSPAWGSSSRTSDGRPGKW